MESKRRPGLALPASALGRRRGPRFHPLLSKHLLVPGPQPGQTRGQRTPGNLFPRARESAPEPSHLSGESEFALLFFFWLTWARDGRQPSPLQRPLSPRSVLSLGSAPAASPRRSCFSASRWPRSRRSIPVCAAGERAGSRPRRSFKFSPARGLALILSLARGTSWPPSAVLSFGLHSAKLRWDPPSRRWSPPCAPRPSPSLEPPDWAARSASGATQRRALIIPGRGGALLGACPPFLLSHTRARTAGLGVTLVVWLFGRSPFRPAGALGPERVFPEIPGPPSRVAERAPRTLPSLGSGRSGFSQAPTLLGAQLLLPREAHCRAEAALGLRPRSVHRAALAAICSEVGDFAISTSSQGPPHGCGVFSRVARKAAPATSRTRRGAPRPPPGEDLVETPTPTPGGGQPLAPPNLQPGRPDSGNGSRSPRRTLAGGVRGRRSAAPTPVPLSEAWLGLAGP
ncbi:uncharacterized protein LOC118993437 [Sturnira hondurensis]|uniref:uncharacterized protein LOC118993437 n=1 Tax=Sturnira hondurensis TaxID=192404 RepID=UPI0018792E99|nr:uncharacterized protein LOC118993437 [Sturnira hondurensis]